MDAYGNYYCTDDGNIPNLLSLPYLGVKPNDKTYLNTRKLLLSADNPYWCIGKAATGLGGPHVGVDMIWPLGVVIEGLTATKDNEIKQCLDTLQEDACRHGLHARSLPQGRPVPHVRGSLGPTPSSVNSS